MENFHAVISFRTCRCNERIFSSVDFGFHGREESCIPTSLIGNQNPLSRIIISFFSCPPLGKYVVQAAEEWISWKIRTSFLFIVELPCTNTPFYSWEQLMCTCINIQFAALPISVQVGDLYKLLIWWTLSWVNKGICIRIWHWYGVFNSRNPKK